MKHAFAAFTLCALFGAASPALAGDPTAEVGKPAPAFTLKDERGKEHSLAQYKGKIVVLEWTNPGCPFVQRHYKAKTMQHTLAGLDAQKVVWLSVDSNANATPERSAAWKKEQGFSYPTLQDASGAVGRSYGAKATPNMFVIDAQGVLRYAGAIDDDARGTSASPVNYVKTAVEALESGKAVPTSTTAPYGCSIHYKS